MAIACVGAGAIWRFVYALTRRASTQIGLLNGIWTALGGQPVTWLQISTLHLNSFLLMVILLWIRPVSPWCCCRPRSRASRPRPSRRPASTAPASGDLLPDRHPADPADVITVFITVLIGVLKIFDIVYVMTNGNFNTNVIAVRLLQPAVHHNNDGYAAAIVVMLLIVDHPDPDLPGPPVPCRGGRPMSGTQAVTPRRPAPRAATAAGAPHRHGAGSRPAAGATWVAGSSSALICLALDRSRRSGCSSPRSAPQDAAQLDGLVDGLHPRRPTRPT